MGLVLRRFNNRLNPGRQLPLGATIDWSHPIAMGLKACYLPGVSPHNLVNSNYPLTYNSVTGFALTNCADGPSMATTGDHAGAATSVLAPVINTPVSHYWRGNLLAAPHASGGSSQLAGVQYGSAQTSPYNVTAILTGSTADGFAADGLYLAWNAGAGQVLGTGYTISSYPSGVISAVGTFLAGGNAILYVNGLQRQSDTFGASQPSTSASSFFCINEWFSAESPGSTHRNAQAQTLMACTWDRVLSASEIQWLDIDPYAFLIPFEGEMSILPGTGGFFSRYYYDMTRAA